MIPSQPSKTEIPLSDEQVRVIFIKAHSLCMCRGAYELGVQEVLALALVHCSNDRNLHWRDIIKNFTKHIEKSMLDPNPERAKHYQNIYCHLNSIKSEPYSEFSRMAKKLKTISAISLGLKGEGIGKYCDQVKVDKENCVGYMKDLYNLLTHVPLDSGLRGLAIETADVPLSALSAQDSLEDAMAHLTKTIDMLGMHWSNDDVYSDRNYRYYKVRKELVNCYQQMEELYQYLSLKF
jgi:hypothetical protein